MFGIVNYLFNLFIISEKCFMCLLSFWTHHIKCKLLKVCDFIWYTIELNTKEVISYNILSQGSDGNILLLHVCVLLYISTIMLCILSSHSMLTITQSTADSTYETEVRTGNHLLKAPPQLPTVSHNTNTATWLSRNGSLTFQPEENGILASSSAVY